MGETRVVNKRVEGYDVYIGRPSKWGNPFVIGQRHQGRTMTREDVIVAYTDWLLYSDRGLTLQADLGELRGQRLGCFCTPEACHGDVLVRLVEERFGYTNEGDLPADQEKDEGDGGLGSGDWLQEEM